MCYLRTGKVERAAEEKSACLKRRVDEGLASGRAPMLGTSGIPLLLPDPPSTTENAPFQSTLARFEAASGWSSAKLFPVPPAPAAWLVATDWPP